MKIIINSCYGGFGVSPRGTLRLNEIKGRPCFLFLQPHFKGPFLPMKEDATTPLGLFFAFDTNDVPQDPSNDWWKEHDVKPDCDDRANLALIQTVEELGEAANGRFAKLKVIEIPDDVEWTIAEYDGIESVQEEHRSWS